MSGRRRIGIRTSRLEAASTAQARSRPRYDLSALSDDELEALTALAERLAATGGAPAWTRPEQALLDRVMATVTVAERRTA